MARLDRRPPEIGERPLQLPEPAWRAIALEAGGRHALIAGGASLFLVDVGGAAPPATTPRMGEVLAADFLNDGAVRVYHLVKQPPAPTAFVVMDWHPRDGSRRERARVTGDARMLLLARRGDLAVVATGVRGKAIVDAASGAIRPLEARAPDFPGGALVLTSGNVALTLGDEVRIVTPAGVAVASMPVDPRTKVYALREPAPGVLAIGLWSLELDRLRTIFVDAATAAVQREEKGLLPAGPRYGSWPVPPDAGSFASRLFTDLDGLLVVLEPDGGKREIVRPRE